MATKIVDYISPAQIGQFNFCAVSYKYCYIDGIKRQDSNIYLLYGSAMHESLAVNYKQKIGSKKDLSVDEVFNTFQNSFSLGYSKLAVNPSMAYTEATNYKTFLVIAEDVLESYLKYVSPSIQPLAVELDFSIKLQKYPITIKGVIDLVTEEGGIIDHKTVGKSNKKAWTQETVDNNFQLTWYAAGYRKLFRKKEAWVQIDVLPREMNPTFYHIKSTRTDEQLHQALSLASGIEKIVELGVFIPNTVNCKVCPFNETCPKLPILIH